MNKKIIVLLLAVITLVAGCTVEDWDKIDRKSKRMKFEIPAYDQR